MPKAAKETDMALILKKEKLYVSNVEKKISNGKEFTVANGSFMSSHKNKEGEWVNDDPFFVDLISFNREVNSLLKEISNSPKKGGFILVDGKLSTKINEVEGKKYTQTSLVVFAAEKPAVNATEASEEAPF